MSSDLSFALEVQMGAKRIKCRDSDAAECDRLRDAIATIRYATHAEECFDQIVEQYIALETACAEILIRHQTISLDEKDEPTIRNRLDRALIIFLNSCRQYREIAANLEHRITKDDQANSKVQKTLEKARSECLRFQAMEMIRNHAQHHGSPLTVIKIKRSKIDTASVFARELKLLMIVDVDELMRTNPNNDGVHKYDYKTKSALLQSGLKKWDAREYVNYFFDSFSRMHNVLRNACEAHVEAASSVIRDFNAETTSWKAAREIAIGAYDTQGNRTSEKTILFDRNLLPRLEELSSKNFVVKSIK